MSCEKYFVIVILACATCAVVAKPQEMKFDLVKDHTVCRTNVTYDTNEERIPKVIKFIKCAEDPYKMCPTTAGNTRCCGALSGAFSCTEVQDDVLVRKASNMETYTMKVAIGCSCIAENPDKAKDDK